MLVGHPLAKRCYAWTQCPGSHYIIAMEKGGINSPEAAVLAWAALKQPMMESLTVQPHWHMQHFLTVGTVGD